jgi:hypothetical protein
MDSQINVEALRAKLRGMSRAEARKVAVEAGLSCSTVEKFRLGHIHESKMTKLQKLYAILFAEAKEC